MKFFKIPLVLLAKLSLFYISGTILILSVLESRDTCDCDTIKRASCESQGQSPNWKEYRLINTQIADIDAELAEKLRVLEERKAAADDKELIEVAKQLLHPPPPDGLKMKAAQVPVPTVQTTLILKLLRNLTGGKFIECGGYDGEVSSPTLSLEGPRGWLGLLIEADPFYYTQLIGKRRNVYSINACISPHPHFSMLSFKDSTQHFGGQVGRISMSNRTRADARRVPCFPTSTLLLALGWTTVDFFSLDLEGLEYPVLTTILWKHVKIRTLSVEFIHGRHGKGGLRILMEGLGYKLEETINYSDPKTDVFIHDLIFSKLKSKTKS